MDEVDARPYIKPKSTSDVYEGQHYTCIFDLNAPPEERWFWEVSYTKVFPIIGRAPTLEKAQRMAKKNIREMKKDVG